MVRTGILSILTIVLATAVLQADTINIPADYPTIQEGIDAAVNGDVVLVAPGTYFEHIDFLGKAITVKSSDGAASTVIDANQAGRGVTFRLGEGPDSVLDGFTIFNGNMPVSGGGIVCRPSCSPSIMNNTISGNSAEYGGGIYCEESSPIIMINLIKENSAEQSGGGIYCREASPTITDNLIAANSAPDGGGAIFLGDSFPVLTNNHFAANKADYGGGINCGNSSLVVKNNALSWNSAHHGGGLYCISSGTTNIESNTITGNTADQGGGIYCSSSSSKIKNNLITENTATYYGGGIYCRNSSDLAITNNTIKGNSSDRGGGIYCNSASPSVRSNMITGNSATLGGGVCCFHWAYPILTNNTLIWNSADNGGGIYCFKRPNVTLVNTILWGNSAPTGPEISLSTESALPTTLSISYSTVKGGQTSVHVEPECTLNWGYGMIESYPLFADLGANDFHLTAKSPCRDSGDNLAVTELYDFEGDPRIGCWGQKVDMGADEFFTHLYVTGHNTPGGTIQIKLVGLPEARPVYLLTGSGVRPAPLPTPYGDYFLLPPSILMPLIPIPADGILELPVRIPTTPPAPYDVPMQALVGLSRDSLTNVCVLEVR